MSRTLQDIVDRVRVIVGDKTSSQFLDRDIGRWATDAQLDIVRATEKPQVDISTVSVAGQYHYPVAGGFIYFRGLAYNGHDLVKTTREQMDQDYPSWRVNSSSPNGVSQMYWLDADSFNLYPTPDTSGLILLASVTPRPTDLVNVTDVLTVPDENFNTVLQVCLQRAQEWGENWDAANYFRQDAKERKTEDAHEAWVSGTDTYPAIRTSPEDYL